MGFYDELAAMAADLLKPDAAGGLGQGAVVLVRVTPGAVNPAEPWVPVAPTTATETLRAAVRGVSKELVGAEGENGVVIVATDLQVIAAVPVLAYQPGDRITIDGAAVNILRVDNIPAAGTRAAIRFIVRN